MSKIKKVVFSVSVSPDHKKRFREICRKENRPQSQMLEIMIDLYEKMKDK